jgi:hypothetical protein
MGFTYKLEVRVIPKCFISLSCHKCNSEIKILLLLLLPLRGLREHEPIGCGGSIRLTNHMRNRLVKRIAVAGVKSKPH